MTLPKGATLAERFEQKVDRSAGPDECHVWIGARKDIRPYWHGEIWNGKRPEGAHRVALRLAGIEIPKGMHVDHICRNGMCVNVKHLRVVTARVNALENNGSPHAANAQKTHCKYGHPFDVENTMRTKTGARDCRICHRRRAREWVERQAQSQSK